MILGAVGFGAWGYVDERWFSGARVLATVGGQGVTLAEVNARIRLWEFFWRPATQEEILEEMIEERLLLAEARARDLQPAEPQVKSQTDLILGNLEGFHGSPEAVSKAMRSARITRAQVEQLVRAWLTADILFEEVTGGIGVTAAAVLAHYETNREAYAEPLEVTVRHILVETEAEAEEILRLLAAGEDFAVLAAERSVDTGSAGQGGLLPWPVVPNDPRLVPGFAAAAIVLGEGETSPPIETEFGFHVIRADAVKPARQLSFDEAEAGIREELLMERRSEAFEAWLKELREKLPVAYEPG